MTKRARKRSLLILLAATVLMLVAGGALWIDSAKADSHSKVRYSHLTHKNLKVDQNNCRKCHVLDNDYDVLPATTGKDHQPCNDSNCHANEFMQQTPKICVVCHDDTDPSVKQTPVVRRRKRSEFGGDLSHKSHTKKVKSSGGKNGACVTCHGNVFKGKKAGKSGHASCASCHGKTSTPSMGTCSGCHKLGAKKARSSTGEGNWSVTAMFSHSTHGNDPRSRKTETACVECHSAIAEATNLNNIQNPKMESCDGCHNGKNAFKTTGFGCYNCHGSASSGGNK